MLGNSSLDRPEIAPRSRNQRSQITNGSRLLLGVDGRSAESRRYRDLVEEFSKDIGALTAGEVSVVKQAAALALKGEMLSAQLVRGENIDSDEIVRTANASARLLASLRRRQDKREPVGASLDEYLASKGMVT